MHTPEVKRNKMEAIKVKSAETAQGARSAGTQRRAPYFTNYRCKQKQYHSVLWSLQFLLALLRHYPNSPLLSHATQESEWACDSCNAASTQSLPYGHTSGADSCSSDPNPAHLSSSLSTALNDQKLRDRVHRFLTAAAGAEGSFDAEGPLSATQLLSLQSSFTDEEVRQLCTTCVQAYVQTRAKLHRSLSEGCGVFAAPTALMQLLWPTTRVTSHYTRALAAAHRNRIDHSDLLALPGYLQEAGLHAQCVFSGKLTEADASVFTTPEEQRAAAEWRRLIRLYTAFLPDRSHIHELENLPQEVAIGELLCEAAAAAATEAATTSSASSSGACGGVCRPLDCVVDVGGGNGFLAAQVAERLGCDGVVIDPFFPAHAIDCCPRLWPDTAARRHPATRRRQTLHRTTALFRDVRWADVVPAPPSRTALVAKHLCGSGVDEVLRQLEAQDCLPRVLVLAPCCFNKITYDTYCDPAYLQEVMGITSEAGLARVHKLTDWNMSCYQSSHEALLANAEAQRRGHRRNNTQGASGACDCFSHSSTFAGATSSGAFSYQRRSGPRSIVNSITCTHAFALLVEGLLNYGRMQWLRRRNYEVRLVQYVPDVVTPKNKCLLAVRKGK